MVNPKMTDRVMIIFFKALWSGTRLKLSKLKILGILNPTNEGVFKNS